MNDALAITAGEGSKMKLVTAAIIIRNGSVLLTRRKAGEKMAGFWEFPGGKLEEGETPRACLERELQEELGVKACAGEVMAESVYHYDHGVIRLLGIRAEIETDRFEFTVHDRAAWVPLSDLLGYKLSPADIPIAETLRSNLSLYQQGKTMDR